MAGILDKKQRLIDFSLTSNGYKQIQNGDLRFVYATLTDKDAVYDRKQNEYNVADIDVMPFFFESHNKYTDVLNTEIDLNINANFNLRTELNGQYINLSNNLYQNTQTLVANSNEIFDKISGSLIENLNNQNIILTNNFYNYDTVLQENKKISLYISKINNNVFLNNDLINTDNNLVLAKTKNLENYFSLVNKKSIDLNKNAMIEDDRFKNKLNYLFLPPSNMNTEVISKNSKIINTFNLGTDGRDLAKTLIKKTYSNTQFNNINEAILDSIKNLNNLSENFQLTGCTKIEMTFDQEEYDSEFLISLFELNENGNQTLFNKLIFINHGEIFDSQKQKNYQVYSVGKLFSSKTEIDLDDNFLNNKQNGEYIIEDNYLFVNLFTIIIE